MLAASHRDATFSQLYLAKPITSHKLWQGQTVAHVSGIGDYNHSLRDRTRFAHRLPSTDYLQKRRVGRSVGYVTHEMARTTFVARCMRSVKLLCVPVMVRPCHVNVKIVFNTKQSISCPRSATLSVFTEPTSNLTSSLFACSSADPLQASHRRYARRQWGFVHTILARRYRRSVSRVARRRGTANSMLKIAW